MEKYNKSISENLTKQQQIEDINYLQKKIYKYQPAIDLFISKEALDKKFDSIKQLTKTPKKSNELYLDIVSVVNSIKQGHNFVSLVAKKLTKKELKKITKLGRNPYSQLDYLFENDQLFVLHNFSKDTLIPNGAEVLKIGELTPLQIKKKYWKSIVSDGFNTTFYNYSFAKRISIFAQAEIGIVDSLKYQFKFKDSVFERVIYRPNFKKEKTIVKKDTIAKKVLNQKELKIKAKADRKKKALLGYDSEKKQYNKELTFKNNDSTVAVLQIRNFMTGNYKEFYQQTFELLQKKQTKTLILDLRNNPGGRLNEIKVLASYFTDKPYQLIEPVEITQRTSLWETTYLKGAPILLYPFILPAYPFIKAVEYIKPKKNEKGTFNYQLSASKIQQPSKYNYKGKIYVLINGGSFSASCLLATYLKSIKNVTFVGEETGGGANQTTAGRMPFYELPHSKLNFNVLLMDIKPTNKSETFGRGIIPDVTINYSINDLVNKIDPQMEWIEKDIKNKD
ncbi:MAG: S41 family peptidase [Flavobacterium sp.]